MSRRTAGPGSSPGLSTKQKTKLWNRLRRLDRMCSIHSPLNIGFKIFHLHKTNEKLYAKYDAQRKIVRAKLKGKLPA